MIRVFVADDHAVVRRGLKEIIDDEDDIEFCGEASDATGLLQAMQECDCDIVVLDITMPGRSGLEVLKDLRTMYPSVQVLVLSMHPEDRYAIRALKAGASGYITKDGAPEELVGAIRTITDGGKYISTPLAEELVERLKPGTEIPPHERLSDREYQVMCMIASGKMVKEIAQELSLSVKTVSTYRAHILEKMNLKSNAEITHYAISNQLVELG